MVTESAEFDGGVLVDENGKIAGVYTRESINELLSADQGSVEVCTEQGICSLFCVLKYFFWDSVSNFKSFKNLHVRCLGIIELSFISRFTSIYRFPKFIFIFIID